MNQTEYRLKVCVVVAHCSCSN